MGSKWNFCDTTTPATQKLTVLSLHVPGHFVESELSQWVAKTHNSFALAGRSIAATLVHISLKNLELPPTPMALFNLPLLHRQGTNLNQNNNLFFQPLRNVLTTTSSTTYQPHFHYYLSGWLGPVSHVFAQASRVSIHFQVLFMATTTKPSSCLW